MTVVLCLAASFFGCFGVEPDQGFFDEPVDLRPAAAVRVRGELPVDERRSLGGEEAGVVGDPQCLPHRHLTVQHACPEPGEAVGELDDLSDVVAAGVQGPAQQGGELHHGEVGDQRCTGSGEREPGVQTPLDQRRSVSFVVDDVLAGPFRDLRGPWRSRALGRCTARSIRIPSEQLVGPRHRVLDNLGRRGGEVEEGCGPEIHETYSIWNIRHNQTPGTRLWTGDPQHRGVDEQWRGALVSRLGAGAPRTSTSGLRPLVSRLGAGAPRTSTPRPHACRDHSSYLRDRNPSEHLKQRCTRAGPGGQRRNQRRRATTSLVLRGPSPKRTASCGRRGLVTVAERPPRPATGAACLTGGRGIRTCRRTRACRSPRSSHAEPVRLTDPRRWPFVSRRHAGRWRR